MIASAKTVSRYFIFHVENDRSYIFQPKDEDLYQIRQRFQIDNDHCTISEFLVLAIVSTRSQKLTDFAFQTENLCTTRILMATLTMIDTDYSRDKTRA